MDSLLSRKTTLGVSATTSALRGTARVHRHLADDHTGAQRPQAHPRPLGCHGLDAQPARFQHEHVVGLFVLTDQDGPLGELPALEVRPQAGRHAGEPIARPVHDDEGFGDSALEQTLLAPLQAAVQVRLEPDDPLGLDDPAVLQLLPHLIGHAREHQLEPDRLRQVHHLYERHHRRGVHARHASEIDHQEPQRCRFHACADPLEQAVGGPEEQEPVHAQDLDTVTHRLQRRALAGRPVDVAVVGLPEGHLAHQLDPPVVDREQDAREHEPDHDAGQKAPPDDRGEDHQDDGVLERRQGPPHVPHPLDDEGEAEEDQDTADDHPRDQLEERRPEHDRRERDERGEEPGGPRVHVHAFGQRAQAERVVRQGSHPARRRPR